MKNKLFKPYQIGNFTLKNRFVFSPINLNLSEMGQVCQADLDFFSARAHSAPMTITGEFIFVNQVVCSNMVIVSKMIAILKV
ncbi:NADPH dehydrogenase [Mesomycoplasma hyopneumoniae]|uniref:NADPH dehydrogenase n=1 Tax=Mesomycoplasma hyopneumoniae TaxID=2099 RepID=A0A223MAA7_MESHO|nr:NADPH dehydrogenase [Mesomycoplasma hyopneumoniae]